MEELKEIITKDGSFSLRSNFFNEDFHSKEGAYYETESKFIAPSLLKKFKNSSINVMDICFGMGYNSAFLFDRLIDQSSTLHWYGLEIDKRPIWHVLRNNSFKNLWNAKVIEIFEFLFLFSKYYDELFSCKLLWGDAREQIINIPKNVDFDLIYLDSFSPSKCPELWSIEFLNTIVSKLKPSGKLITYSSSASVRKSLIKSGLKIYNIKPINKKNNLWSYGTFAIKDVIHNVENPFIEELTLMQREHLTTKASIPYRDPDRNSKSEEIINRRKNEQQISTLTSTRKWREKWGMTKPDFGV